MNIEEKIFSSCNELVVKIEEKLYMIDKDFDSGHCNYILYIIGKKYIEKNNYNLFEKQMCIFINNCILKLDDNSKFDCIFLYNNLSDLLALGFINHVDLLDIKNTLYNYLFVKEKLDELKKNDKKLVLSYIG